MTPKINFKNSKTKFLSPLFHKKTRGLFIILIIFIFSFHFIYSYNDTDTHPDLTVEIVKLYNLQNQENKLSNEEMELVRQGSISEDTPPRWINHFYNPETGEGWTADNLKGVSQDNLQTVSEWFLSHEPPVSSLNWARNQELQNKYSLYKGNHTFQKAVYDYAMGEKEEGLKSLGYILHLIEDASVPDHTRDDTHADISNIKDNADEGSPYENWSENYTKNNSLNIAEDLNSKNKKYYKCENFDSCLIKLASYSHNNFFSEDTIGEYNQPKIERWENFFDFSIGYSEINKQLIYKKLDKDKKTYFTLSKKDNNLVLSSYWSHLSSEAVLTGAGVIDLFFKEAEKAKKDYEYLDSLKFKEKELTTAQIAFMPAFYLFLGDVVSPAGEYFRGARIYSGAKFFLQKAGSLVSSSLSSIKNKIIESFSFGNQQAGPPVLSDGAENVSGGDNIDENNAGAEVQNVNPENQADTAVNNQNENTGGGFNDFGQNIQNVQDVRSNKNSKNNRNSNLKTAENLNGQNLNNLDKNKFAAAEQTKKIYLPASHDKNQPAIIAGFGGETQFPSVSVIDDFQINSSNQNEQNSSTTNNQASSTLPFAPSAPDQNNGDQNNASSTDNSDEEQNNSTSTPPVYDNIPPEPPIIISPDNLSQIFTNSQITFSGTAEPNTTLLGKPDFPSEATTSVSSGGLWSLTFNLDEGTTTINFYATDSAGNISSSTRAEIFVDSKAPEITEFKVWECDNSISADGCLIATTTVNLIWSAGAGTNDLDYFEIAYGENMVSTTSTSTKLILNDNAAHTISLRAKDINGNFSESLAIELEINTKPIIINEVAWAGTGRTTSNDEWIELYNRTNKSINLNNFVLYASDFSPYINLQNQIPAKGYYLLERTNNETVSDIPADQFFTGAINNRNENLILAYVFGNGTTTIDYTYFCTDSGRWCGGSDDNYQTMERYNYDENIWGTHLVYIYNGKNANNEAILGTPKARNSLNYLLSTTTPYLQADTVLKKENSPYFIVYTFTVPQGKKLTIEPGVVIKIKGGSGEFLDIYGELYAQGAESEPIVFTSFYDDEYGGDLNGDGGETTPVPGSWAKIILENTSSSTISYAKFRYGGKHYGHCCNSMVKIHDATSTITNSVFENSYSYGLELMNSNSYVSYNIFRNNNNTLNFSNPTGLRIVSGAPKIINNIFENNFKGIDISSGSAAEIENNIFNNNINKAIYVIGNDGMGIFKNNSGVLAGGSADGIYITDLRLQENSMTTLYSNSFPYIFTNNPLIRASSALIVKPGVLIKNSDMNRIEVFGSLITEGESPGDIVFTSLYDPLESYWFGISANPGSSVRLSGATIKNGGKILSFGPKEKEAALYIDSTDAKIENSLFENNYKNGIIAMNANPDIKDTEFKNHLNPAFNSRGITYYNSEINLENTAFRNNFLGIYADAASVLGVVSDIIFEENTGTSTINLFP